MDTSVARPPTIAVASGRTRRGDRTSASHRTRWRLAVAGVAALLTLGIGPGAVPSAGAQTSLPTPIVTGLPCGMLSAATPTGSATRYWVYWNGSWSKTNWYYGRWLTGVPRYAYYNGSFWETNRGQWGFNVSGRRYIYVETWTLNSSRTAWGQHRTYRLTCINNVLYSGWR